MIDHVTFPIYVKFGIDFVTNEQEICVKKKVRFLAAL